MTDIPDGVPGHLIDFLRNRNVNFEFLAPGVPMPTVPLAAAAIGVSPELILKTILFGDHEGAYLVAIASGLTRIDPNRLEAVAAMRKPRPANPADVIRVTGYPAGGVAPLGLPASIPVVVDAATAALTIAYGGGGHEHLLLRVQVSDVIRYNNALVAEITERPNHAGR